MVEKKRVTNVSQSADGVDGDRRSVIIACTLRSGSNLLCELLQRLGYGAPTEFFQTERYRNVESIRKGLHEKLPDLAEFYAKFESLHKGHAWRGVKWNFEQFHTFCGTIASHPTLSSLENWLPNARWVSLRRQDLLAQAVSIYVAKHTGLWVAGDTPILQNALTYDFDAIWHEFVELSVEQMLWDHYFRKTKIPFFAINYEELNANPTESIRRVIEFIDPLQAESCNNALLDTQNKKIVNPMIDELLIRFRLDIESKTYRNAGMNRINSTLLDIIRNFEKNTVIEKFMGNHDGLFPVFSKIHKQSELKIEGNHQWIEQPHFLDRVAIRLDAGSTLGFEQNADRVLVEFLSHPWSGRCTVVMNGAAEVIDLYNDHSSVRSWMAVVPAGGQLNLQIRPLSSKSDLSEGTEIWVQRIWLMQTKIRT